jgi:two-component system OmpR family sensor kinase
MLPGDATAAREDRRTPWATSRAPSTIDGEGTYRVRACPVDNGSVLLSAAPQKDLDGTVQQLITVEVVAFALALAGAGGRRAAGAAARAASAGDMAGTAHDIASHDLTANPACRLRAERGGGGAEVEELRTAFNVMLEHIDDSLAAKTEANERLRRFVADASHELRTPLTSMRGYADLFRYAAANEPAEREAHLAKIRAETARMSVLVDDLLLLARLDARSRRDAVAAGARRPGGAGRRRGGRVHRRAAPTTR